MKKHNYLLAAIGVPVILMSAIYFILNLDEVDYGFIVVLSLYPMFLCVYLWVLISNSSYLWVRRYYRKYEEKVDYFIKGFAKFSLVMFPILCLLLGPILAQKGYERIEVDRSLHPMAETTHYYRKETEKKE